MKIFQKFLILSIVLGVSVFGYFNFLPGNSKAEGGNFTTKNNQIYINSKKINLYGVNWFGFEDKNLIIHGTWNRSISSMIKQIKEFGFNAVRVPFCPETLQNKPVGYFNASLNPDYEGLDSLEFFDNFISDLAENDLYFILDHHSIDCKKISPLWYGSGYTEDDWIKDLAFVAKRYSLNPYFVGIDIKNENHSIDSNNYPQWGTGDLDYDFRLAAQKAGKEILKNNPNILIFVGGIDNHQKLCSEESDFMWGANFMPYQCYPIDNTYIPENKIVLSPHVYGPDVSSQNEAFKDSNFPKNMPAIWEKSFGFLTETGATVVPTEFGGKYGLSTKSGKGLESDKEMQIKLIDYFIQKDICNFFYWSYNPNSSNTGGLLKDDWETPVGIKIDNISRLIKHCNSLK
jgi:endoglucanase